MSRATLRASADRFARLLRGLAERVLRAPAARSLASIVAVAIVVALGFVAADVAGRPSLGAIDLGAHIEASIALYVAAGFLLGLAVAAASGAAWLASLPLATRWPRLAGGVRAAVVAAIGAASLQSTAFWLFSGAGAQASALSSWGPYVAIIALFLGFFLFAFVADRALDAVARGRTTQPLVVALALIALGAGLVFADFHVLVALYTRLHTAMELCAALLLVAGGSVALALLTRRFPRAAYASAAIFGLGLVWTAVLFGSSETRSEIEAELPHVVRDPAYVGRMLGRVKLIEAYAEGHDSSRALAASQIQALLDRYDLDAITRDPRWDAPPKEPPELAEAIRARRGGRSDYNVIVYYVDTLRRDVAYDDEAMPNVAKFARENQRFDRAWSAGSDTLRSLPAMLAGSYDIEKPSPNGIVEVAKRNGIDSTLFISESAYLFLDKLLPTFKLDHTERFSDYAKGGVWGYGADQSTAGPIVDHALDWLSKRGDERFFLWLFNFDVHNWRELNREMVYGAAQRLAVPEEGPWNWRYRVAARNLDDHFGRLIQGLSDLGLSEKTVVVFVSDHGEALGYRDYWVHAIFLWDSLLRVPLIVHVPGLEPHAVAQDVSLVDVAPTLARFMDPDPPMGTYHGEDLLGALTTWKHDRRLPILFASAADQQLSKVGLLEGPWKLVMPIDWSEPQLYDLRAKDPDEIELATQEPAATLRLTSTLLRSPFFMNAYEKIVAEEAEAQKEGE